MATHKTGFPKKAAVAEPPSSPDTATIAAQISALLDQIVALIPNYEPVEAERLRAVAANAKFGPELLEQMTTAVVNYGPLREKNFFDVDAARRALGYRKDMNPVAERMAVVTAALQYTIKKLIADSVAQALEGHNWSQRHIRRPEGKELRPYAENVARTIEKTLNRRPKSDTAPAPPAPQGFLAGALPQPVEKDEDDLLNVLLDEMEESKV